MKLKAFIKALGLLLAGGVGFAWFFDPFSPVVIVSNPGPTGYRIAEDGLLANFFPGKSPDAHAGILMLGGSEGGLSANVTSMALDLQMRGYSVLYVSYFGAPGQSRRLERIRAR